MYLNYRCRKCGGIISREVKKVDRYKAHLLYLAVSTKEHQNCIFKIQEDEKVFADPISYSETPLLDAIDILEYNYEKSNSD